MSLWLFLLLACAFLLIVFNGAMMLLPHNRLLNRLTRPIRACFWLQWSKEKQRPMTYRQAYKALYLMEIRERRLHR